MAEAPLDATRDAALDAARRTAEDGAQRAVEVQVEDLQALHDLRLDLQRELDVQPGLERVRPWVWNGSTSGGRALTVGGVEHGFELRLSRYARPLR